MGDYDLHIGIYGDDSNFTSAMSRTRDQVRKTAREVEQSGMSIEQMFNRIKIAAAGALAGFSVKEFASKVVQVRGEFQQLEVAFNTMLGSAEKASSLMQQLTKTAAMTPFDLQGVTQGAKQLLAYGVAAEDVNDTLIHLGDIAAGLSIPLGDLVYLYGTTMTQGRMFTQDLRQFMGRGIPIAEELAKQFGVTKDKVQELVSTGKVGAKEFNQAILSMSTGSGKFAGLMEAQSKTITGQISNIEDAIDVMFNEIGQKSEGIINGTLETVSLLVENYEKVGKVILGVVAAYGAYKAAVLAYIAIQKVHNTWIALEQTAHLQNALATDVEIAAKGRATVATVLFDKAQAALNKTMLANPYVLAGMAIIGLTAIIYKAVTATNEFDDAQERLSEQAQENEASVLKELNRLDELNRKLLECEKGSNEYKNAKQAIIDQFGQYYSGLDAEIEKVGNLSGVYDQLTESIRRSIGARNLKSFYDKEMDNYDKTVSGKLDKAYKSLKDKYGESEGSRLYHNLYSSTILGNKNALSAEDIGKLQKTTFWDIRWGKNAKDGLVDFRASLDDLREDIYDTKAASDKALKDYKDMYEITDEQWNEALFGKKTGGTSPTPGAGTGGKGGKSGGGRNDIADRAAERIRAELELAEAAMKARIETERAISEAYVAAIEDDSEREREARRIQHENTVRDIQAQEDDFYKSVYEARKKAYEAANKGKYENTAAGAAGWSASVMAGTLTESEQQQYVTATKKMHAQLEKENAEYFRSVASDIAQEERTNKEAISNYLKQYGDYAEKKQAIYSDANDKICEYEKQLSQATTEEGRAAAQARIDTVKEETKAQISELDVQYGKAKAFMVDLFEDTSSKSINAINEIIEKYETLLRFLKGDGSVTRGTLLDYGFSDSEIDKALQNMKTNGVSSIKDITDALKNLRREVGTRSVWQQLKQDINDANAATDNGTKIQMMAQVALEAIPQFESLGNAIFSAFDIDDSQMKSATQALKDFASVAKGIGQFKSGDKIGGFMSIASAIVSAAGQIAGAIDEEKQKDRQRILSRIDHRLQITDERISELNETLRSSYGLEAQRVAEESRQQAKTKQQQALEGLMGVNVSGKGQLDISQLAKTLGEMYGLNYGPDRTGNVYGTMMGFMWNDLLRNNPAEDLINMFIEQRDMIASVLGDEWDKILEYIDAMKDAQDTINDTMMMEKEQIVGTTFGSVFDDMLNSLYDLGDGAEDVFSGISDGWQQMINRMVINNMLAEDMRKELQDWYDQWHDAWENDNDITSDELESLREGYNNIFSEYSGKVEQLRNMGIIKSIAKSEEEAMDELEEATMDYLDNMRSAFEDLVSDSETNMEEWSINLRNSILRNLIQSKLLDEEFDKWANDWAERYSNIISAYNGGNIQKSVYEGLMDDLMAEFNQRTGEIAEKSQQMWEAFGLSIPEQQAEEAAEEMKSAFSDLHQSFLSTLTDMNGDAEAWSKQITKTMVEQMVEKNILNDAFDGAMDDWRERFENALTAGDTAGLKALRQELYDLRSTLAEQAQSYMEALGYMEDVADEIAETVETPLDDLRSMFRSNLLDMKADAEDLGEDIGRALSSAFIDQFVLGDTFDRQVEDWKKQYEAIMGGGMTPEQRAAQLSQLKKTIADAREGYAEQARLIHDLVGTAEYGDQQASVNMADKATYDQFEMFLGMQTAMMIGQEQGNAVRVQILNTLQAMGGITSPNSGLAEQLRNMMMLSNEYLLDIKRSNREIQSEFGSVLNSINNKLSRL